MSKMGWFGVVRVTHGHQSTKHIGVPIISPKRQQLTNTTNGTEA